MSRPSSWRNRTEPMRRVASDRADAGGESEHAAPGATPPELPGLDLDDIDPEELREFMAADRVEVKADPAFRERLRARLWKMLSEGIDETRGEDDSDL